MQSETEVKPGARDVPVGWGLREFDGGRWPGNLALALLQPAVCTVCTHFNPLLSTAHNLQQVQVYATNLNDVSESKPRPASGAAACQGCCSAAPGRRDADDGLTHCQ